MNRTGTAPLGTHGVVRLHVSIDIARRVVNSEISPVGPGGNHIIEISVGEEIRDCGLLQVSACALFPGLSASKLLHFLFHDMQLGSLLEPEASI